MPNAVQWSITNVRALPRVGELEKVVISAHYRAYLADTYIGRHPDDPANAPQKTLPVDAEYTGVAQFELDPGGEFIPAEDLTKAVILGWVKDQLGVDAVNEIEDRLRARIDRVKNPPEPTVISLALN